MKGQKGEQSKLLTGGDSLIAYETEDQETQYCFPDINSSCVKEKHSSHGYIIIYVFVSLLSAWTVFLNLLVIISISHFKKLHTPTNMIILFLAVTDLFIRLAMPIEANRLIETCWYFGDTFCGHYLFFVALLLSASLGNLVLIAVDRYMAVSHPLQYPQKITITKTFISICLNWVCISAYFTALVNINNRDIDTSHKTNVCYGQCSVMISFSWLVINLFMSFIFPCTLIITLYLRIFYVVHQQVKVINSLMKGGKCVTEGSAKRKSESKAALTLEIIVSVYLLCWIPYCICSLTVNSTAINVLVWVVYANSGLNPLVYALFYSWFKKTAKLILTLKIFHPASSMINIFTEH